MEKLKTILMVLPELVLGVFWLGLACLMKDLAMTAILWQIVRITFVIFGVLMAAVFVVSLVAILVPRDIDNNYK